MSKRVFFKEHKNEHNKQVFNHNIVGNRLAAYRGDNN
jgi:hypothetical protein